MSKVMETWRAKLAQIEKLQAEAQADYDAARNETLIDVKAKIKEFGFNKRELGLPARSARVHAPILDVAPKKTRTRKPKVAE